MDSPVVWEHSLHPHPHPQLPWGHPGRSRPTSCPRPSQLCPGRPRVQGLDPGQGHYHLRDSIGQPVEGPRDHVPAGLAPSHGLMGGSPHDLPGFWLWVPASWSLSFFQDRTACPFIASPSPSPAWVPSQDLVPAQLRLGPVLPTALSEQRTGAGEPPRPDACGTFRQGNQGAPPGILSVSSSAAPCGVALSELCIPGAPGPGAFSVSGIVDVC